ncbi:MAG: 50S ribosomal protein L10 [Erysipelothrix sp.]|nr:50S ribosomal protein L10 [Erysipelothrix sp.]
MSSDKILQYKQGVVSEIAEQIKESASTVVVEYRGLSVADLTEIRAALREEDVEFKVYKNTMVRLAAKEAGHEELVEHLVGPNGFAFGPDAVAPARILAEFGKKHKKLQFKAGVVSGNVLDVEGLTKLSKLPNKDGMLSMLVGMLQSPIRDVAMVFKAVGESMEENQEA